MARVSRADQEAFLEDVAFILDTGDTNIIRVAQRLGTTPWALTRRLYRLNHAHLTHRLDGRGRHDRGSVAA